MHKTYQEVLAFSDRFQKNSSTDISCWIAPSFPYLITLIEVFRGTSVKIGAQNIHFSLEGAFTGEVSAPMIASIGSHFVLIGHSERRRMFLESGEILSKKVACALEHRLQVVFCVGETLEQRNSNQTKQVLEQQLLEIFSQNFKEEISHIKIAYEPVWAIGTGLIASLSQIEEAHRWIRNAVEMMAGRETAKLLSILYGGSVSPENCNEIRHLDQVQGFLVGGASLDVEKFLNIIGE